MKILVIGRQFPDSFARNIAVTLDDMGHKVLTYTENRIFPRFHSADTLGSQKYLRYLEDQLIKFSTRIEDFAYGDLVQLVKSSKLDFILVTYHHIPPRIIDRLRQESKARVALWYPDTMCNFDRQYIFSANFDAMFFKDPFIVNFVEQKFNKSVYYLPEACNPKWHQRVRLSESDYAKYGCDLTFAGNMYPYRIELLKQFADYDFKIWGNAPPSWLIPNLNRLNRHHQGKFVAEHEKAKAFGGAKIVLNTLFYCEIEGVNCRLFEAAGCGAFQIVDKKRAVKNLFEEGREIVVFETKEELKEKVDYYLRHPMERKKIAERAYQRAHQEHTYRKRLETMLDKLF